MLGDPIANLTGGDRDRVSEGRVREYGSNPGKPDQDPTKDVAKAGNSSVPKPKPEKNVRADASNATVQTTK